MGNFVEELNEKINSLGISPSKYSKLVRFVAAERLADCKYMPIEGIDGLKSIMKGTNKELTEEVLLDALVLSMADKDTDVKVSLPNSKIISKTLPCKSCSLVSPSEVRGVLGLRKVENSIEGYTEKANNEDLEPVKKEEEITKESEEVKSSEEQLVNPKEKEILKYYSQYCTGVVQELLKRYTAMFSSGYEVIKPTGILTKNGLVKVAGGARKVEEDSVSTTKMYELFMGRLNFVEVEDRSIVNIANVIYDSYTSGGKRLLYFPNKMLEFAYGLCAPTGDNQNSVNTYTRHADANNWSKYRDGELSNAIKRLVNKTTVGYIMKTMKDGDYRNSEVMNGVGNFLGYLRDCLSFCILFPEYETGIIDGVHEVASFKVRICDPSRKLLQEDLTPSILQVAFMGGVGKVPFSYPPRVEEVTCVVEYAHEFNHNMAQATPLFAYKALESLKEQGISLSFDNLILGTAEDGSMLRGGTHGVNLTKHLTHNIVAGSRAGKGVMTLNILASGIASNKNVIYLDRKPDMASLLKYISPSMPVINGGDIQKGYDSFNQWQDMVLDNVPDEVCEAFGVNPSWNELGDLVYMRLLKLAIGVLMVRGSSHTEPEFGGKEGLLIVVDEFSNFQRSYMSMLSTLSSCIPPVSIEKARSAVSEGKMSEADYNRVYNNAGYYALSYLNSMMADIGYLKTKKDAGYDPLETARSDIFVIGQSLEKCMFNYEEFKETFNKSSASGRYKSVDAKGLTKGSFAVGNQSIPFNIVNFKTSDAFFGRNMDDGRDKYLAQTAKGSKANGRLDDKASNFAYCKNFSETTRKKIVDGTNADNIQIAKDCVYFKPYLILNSSGMNDSCVKDMFDRVEKNAGISASELIAENPSYNDPSKLNEAVGFIDYINMAGINNVRSILKKSSVVLNHVVQNVLKYPGDWYQFITDLSPEWLFTIKDIVDAVETGNCGLYNPSTNPILAEYVDFNPQRFSGDYEDSTTKSERAMDEFFYTEDTSEDFSDMAKMDRDEAERLKDALGDNDAYRPDDDIDIFEDGDSYYEPILEGKVQETGHNAKEMTLEDDPDSKRIKDLLSQLAALGVDIEIGDDNGNTRPYQYQQSEPTSFGEDLGRLDYEDDVTSLEGLVQLITKDVIGKFGGVDRITSLKVIGGSIIVNGYYYRCRIKDLYAKNIPYDIRRDINSGNISKLFDYSTIRGMHHIRDLEFDSLSFTYDYVSAELGFKNNISIDKFFELLPSLQVLTVGTKRFDRVNYMAQVKGDDIFYKPKKSTELADASEAFLKKLNKNAWGYTKNAYHSNKHGKLGKISRVVGGTAVTVGSGVTGIGVKASRGIIKKVKVLGRGINDLFNT